MLAGLRCYVCDSRSVIGYYDAEKDCNTDRSLQQCPDIKVFSTFLRTRPNYCVCIYMSLLVNTVSIHFKSNDFK